MAKPTGVGATRFDPNFKQESADGKWLWRSPDVEPISINGLAGYELDGVYRRLPLKTPVPLPGAVNRLADCTAGGQIRFRTDAKRLAVRVVVAGSARLDHMAATDQCGFDLYIGPFGNKNYVATARPGLGKTCYESLLFDFTESTSQIRDVTINFPLYQAVDSIYIGTECGAKVYSPESYQSDYRVLFYGTSITQGGCASRPGLAYTNILSRNIPLEFFNLGFSGSGKGESEVAIAIREIERPACLVLDYEANCTTERYMDTLLPFIHIYREVHPMVPVLVMSRIPYARDRFEKEKYDDWIKRKQFAKDCVKVLRQEGDQWLHFIDGSQLFQHRWHEFTVDGVHPNDLGFMTIASALEPILKETLLNAGSLKGPK